MINRVRSLLYNSSYVLICVVCVGDLFFYRLLASNAELLLVSLLVSDIIYVGPVIMNDDTHPIQQKLLPLFLLLHHLLLLLLSLIGLMLSFLPYLMIND